MKLDEDGLQIATAVAFEIADKGLWTMASVRRVTESAIVAYLQEANKPRRLADLPREQDAILCFKVGGMCFGRTIDGVHYDTAGFGCRKADEFKGWLPAPEIAKGVP